MPLVVPGINSTGGGNKDEWKSKLLGKKLTDSHEGDHQVSRICIL